MLSTEEKAARLEARRVARREAKEQARIAEAQRPVDSITITITWTKSRTWGSNPHAEARVHFKTPTEDGEYGYLSGVTCSGCGYDKESTVIAQVFNAFLKYKLWKFTLEQLIRDDSKPHEERVPYGVGVYSDGKYRGYSSGIGTNCYYRIAEFIGGTFEHVASGKMFDVYKYTDKEGK